MHENTIILNVVYYLDLKFSLNCPMSIDLEINNAVINVSYVSLETHLRPQNYASTGDGAASVMAV